MTEATVTVCVHDLGPEATGAGMRAHARVTSRALWQQRPAPAPDAWRRTRAGRPRSPVPGHDCSVTHDRGWVGVGAGEVRIGLDAMRWRPVRPSVAAWLRSLPPLVAGRTGDRTGHDDLVSWTRAEAIVKYAGASLLQEWRCTALGLPPAAIDRFVRAGGTVHTWTLPQGPLSLAHWRPCRVILLTRTAAVPTEALTWPCPSIPSSDRTHRTPGADLT